MTLPEVPATAKNLFFYFQSLRRDVVAHLLQPYDQCVVRVAASAAAWGQWA
jgi:hypothetical protein